MKSPESNCVNNDAFYNDKETNNDEAVGAVENLEEEKDTEVEKVE